MASGSPYMTVTAGGARRSGEPGKDEPPGVAAVQKDVRERLRESIRWVRAVRRRTTRDAWSSSNCGFEVLVRAGENKYRARYLLQSLTSFLQPCLYEIHVGADVACPLPPVFHGSVTVIRRRVRSHFVLVFGR